MFSKECALLQVFVSAPGYRQLVVALPFGVDACAASAQLAEDGAELLLRLPFKPYRTCVEEASLPRHGTLPWTAAACGNMSSLTTSSGFCQCCAGQAGDAEAARAPLPGQSLDGAGRVNLPVIAMHSPCNRCPQCHLL